MTRSSRSPVVQTLEARRLLAVSIIDRVLTIHGTDFRDDVYVEITQLELRVEFMAADSGVGPRMDWFTLADFDTIRVKTFGNKDSIEFRPMPATANVATLSQPLFVHSGGGNDSVYVGPDLFDTTIHIFAGGGNDYINMPAGESTQRSTLKSFVYGEGADDRIIVQHGMLRASGGSGNDTIIGGSQTDILYGDGGDDVIDAARGNATVHGGTGNDNIRARQGTLDLRGGHGRDTLYAYFPRSLSMYGGDDDDHLRVSGPLVISALLDGGRGHDVLNVARIRSSGSFVTGVSLVGGGGGDTLIGSRYNESFYGQGGHDVIYTGTNPDNNYIEPDDDDVIIRWLSTRDMPDWIFHDPDPVPPTG